jgi:hypothetical protein
MPNGRPERTPWNLSQWFPPWQTGAVRPNPQNDLFNQFCGELGDAGRHLRPCGLERLYGL